MASTVPAASLSSTRQRSPGVGIAPPLSETVSVIVQGDAVGPGVPPAISPVLFSVFLSVKAVPFVSLAMIVSPLAPTVMPVPESWLARSVAIAPRSSPVATRWYAESMTTPPLSRWRSQSRPTVGVPESFRIAEVAVSTLAAATVTLLTVKPGVPALLTTTESPIAIAL